MVYTHNGLNCWFCAPFLQFHSCVDTTMHMRSAAIATAKKVNIINLEGGWETRTPILMVRVKKQRQKTSECVYDK